MYQMTKQKTQTLPTPVYILFSFFSLFRKIIGFAACLKSRSSFIYSFSGKVPSQSGSQWIWVDQATHIHTYGQFRVTNQPACMILNSERKPSGNPCKHEEYAETSTQWETQWELSLELKLWGSSELIQHCLIHHICQKYVDTWPGALLDPFNKFSVPQ